MAASAATGIKVFLLLFVRQKKNCSFAKIRQAPDHRISSTGTTPSTASPERMIAATADTRASRAIVSAGCDS
jgi:hypothetical protein